MPPRNTAMLPEPGMPNSRVGIRPPPSLALFADSGASTPPDIAVSELGLVTAGLDDVAVGDPVDHATAETGNRADYGTDAGAADAKPPIPHHVFQAVEPTGAKHPGLGDRAILAQQIDDLGKGEDAQADHHERQAVIEIIEAEGHAELARGRGPADASQDEADPACRKPLGKAACRQARRPWKGPTPRA